jgi:amidase
MAFNPLTTTVQDLSSRLSSNTLTSVQILTIYLAQIARHNHAGQKLNALINIAPTESLYAQARALDEERKQGKLRGPLHGLPTVVKDCFVFEEGLGLDTTVGAWCFVGEKGRRNADVVQQVGLKYRWTVRR